MYSFSGAKVSAQTSLTPWMVFLNLYLAWDLHLPWLTFVSLFAILIRTTTGKNKNVILNSLIYGFSGFLILMLNTDVKSPHLLFVFTMILTLGEALRDTLIKNSDDHLLSQIRNPMIWMVTCTFLMLFDATDTVTHIFVSSSFLFFTSWQFKKELTAKPQQDLSFRGFLSFFLALSFFIHMPLFLAHGLAGDLSAKMHTLFHSPNIQTATFLAKNLFIRRYTEDPLRISGDLSLGLLLILSFRHHPMKAWALRTTTAVFLMGLLTYETILSAISLFIGRRAEWATDIFY